MLKDTVTSTTYGAALSATGATSGIAFPAGFAEGDKEVVAVIVASAVTNGGTLQVEVKSGDGWRPVDRFDITANGTYAIPLRDAIQRRAGVIDPGGSHRVNCTARTDGTFTCTYTTIDRA